MERFDWSDFEAVLAVTCGNQVKMINSKQHDNNNSRYVSKHKPKDVGEEVISMTWSHSLDTTYI